MSRRMLATDILAIMKILLFIINTLVANRGPDGQRGEKTHHGHFRRAKHPILFESIRKWIQTRCFLIYCFSSPPVSLSTHILTVTRIDAGALNLRVCSTYFL